MILSQSEAYRSSNRAAVQRQTYFLCQACLPVVYTVFCDEDSGDRPSSFQMDVLHHEFSESMFCRYIMRPRDYVAACRAACLYNSCIFKDVSGRSLNCREKKSSEQILQRVKPLHFTVNFFSKIIHHVYHSVKLIILP